MLGAIIAQLFSLAATFSLVYHARPTPPSSPLDWGSAIALAVALEILFIYMKEGLFRAGIAKKVAGAFGLAFDGAINTGGVLPFASRILTFAPVALILGVFGVNLADPLTLLIAGAILSFVLGFLLSILPHWLWPRRTKK
jgi:hypothetical protein